MEGVILLGFNCFDGEYHWWKNDVMKNMKKLLYDKINITKYGCNGGNEE